MASSTQRRASDDIIPVVDFSGFLHGTKEERSEVARQIDDAFRSVGFVYLKGHGVESKIIEDAFEVSKEFFDLPMETKMLAPHPPGGTHHRGYSAPGVEKVSQDVFGKGEIAKLREVGDLSLIPDAKESYDIGNPTDSTQPNIWPPTPPFPLPTFRPKTLTLFHSLQDLTHQVLNALSLSLSLQDPTYLSTTHKSSLFQLRLLHYPPIPISDLQSGTKKRITPHSDFGTLTLLLQDSAGGLEIQDPKDPTKWRPAIPIPGTILVNIGDLMARWSNDRWKSTIHRVGVPDSAGKTAEKEGVLPGRYSIPFFATADPDTVIEALPGCWDEEKNPKKYEAVTAWEYVQMRMAALYE
ncbi:thymine dioxygenase [Westerdykella ornata]|uniref:Thymine dioxygenase n=1 Tax=Westerdykella ornata TaxID=318751 RepID=A0A6A6JQU1_WESOR|nr:thymine dioxygenase [Westerdykella ornata]KAF2278268.1 thymine dioxygenase [Westerdykella ornata]